MLLSYSMSISSINNDMHLLLTHLLHSLSTQKSLHILPSLHSSLPFPSFIFSFSRGRSIKEILQTAMTVREGVAFQSQGLHAEEAIEHWQATFETQTKACYQELLAQREAQQEALRISREGTSLSPLT